MEKETLRTSAAFNFTATAIILRLVPFKRRSHTKEVCSATTAPFPPPPFPPFDPLPQPPPLRTALATVLDCWWLPFSRYISPSRAARSRSTPITSWLPPHLVSFPGGERDTGGHTDATQNKRRTKAERNKQGGGGKRCERREAAQRGRTGREENRKRRLPRQTQGRAHRRTADYLEPFLRAITRSSLVLNLG